MIEALRVYDVIKRIPINTDVQLVLPSENLVQFAEWASSVRDFPPELLILHPPPWAHDHSTFIHPDLLGFVRISPESTVTDPASFDVLTPDDSLTDHTLYPLFAPGVELKYVKCLVDCINAGFVYGMEERFLIIAIATLAAHSRRPGQHRFLPVTHHDRGTVLTGRHIYFS